MKSTVGMLLLSAAIASPSFAETGCKLTLAKGSNFFFYEPGCSDERLGGKERVSLVDEGDTDEGDTDEGDDGDKGHGNDHGHHDPSNPGKGKGRK